MNITILNYSGYSPAKLGMTAHSCAICADDCLDSWFLKGRFLDAAEALSFARRELSTYYIARDDVTGDYLVFSRAAA